MPRRADFFLMLTWHDKNAISIKWYLFRFNLRLLSYLRPAGTRFLRRTAKLRPAGVILRPAGTRFLRRTAKPRPAGFAPYGRIMGALRAPCGRRTALGGKSQKGFAPTRSALTG